MFVTYHDSNRFREANVNVLHNVLYHRSSQHADFNESILWMSKGNFEAYIANPIFHL